MDLFGFANDKPENLAGSPLSELLRPKTLDEMLGQPKILGENTPWRKLITSGQLPSLILWGPPGSGKTTFALLVTKYLEAEVINQNAIEMGAKALRELGEAARRRRLEFQRKTVLFIDEIHRLNKAQQDVLLPFVERGDLLLIGATTENPSYELNSALLSRCRILVFERLTHSDLAALFGRACALKKAEPENVLTADALVAMSEMADGDGRRLINMADVILKVFESTVNGQPLTVTADDEPLTVNFPLQLADLPRLLDVPHLRYDKTADEHYDTISAFIKSVRGSDPDAAIYYLARMIKGGEDPVFIARRLVVLASEDIGNADPRGLSMAIAGLQAVELVGWPEARICLAQVTTYLASAPKSNRAYMAINDALEFVEKTGSLPIPLALRSAKTSAMKNLGYGKGYKYSHDGEKGFKAQQFLPEDAKDQKFYDPTDHGFEKNIRQYLEWLRK
jgi:putative ATPase